MLWRTKNDAGDTHQPVKQVLTGLVTQTGEREQAPWARFLLPSIRAILSVKREFIPVVSEEASREIFSSDILVFLQDPLRH